MVGGGLLGLQVARALARRGLAVEVVEGGEHLLRGQVDAKAGAILARDLRRLGTAVYTGARATRLTDDGLRPGQRGACSRPTSSCSPPAADPRPRWPAGPGWTYAAGWSSTSTCAPATRTCTPSATAPSTVTRSPGSCRRRGSRPACWPRTCAGADVTLRRDPHGGPAARHRSRRGRARRPRARRGPGRRGDQPGRRLASQAGRPRRRHRGRDAGRRPLPGRADHPALRPGHGAGSGRAGRPPHGRPADAAGASRRLARRRRGVRLRGRHRRADPRLRLAGGSPQHHPRHHRLRRLRRHRPRPRR